MFKLNENVEETQIIQKSLENRRELWFAFFFQDVT